MSFATNKVLGCIGVAGFVWMLLVPSGLAQDTLKLKSGEVLTGEVQSIAQNGTVTFRFSGGTIPYPRNNIDTITLEPRPEYKQGVAASQQGDYEKAIQLLQPLVDKFLGIASPWVGQAAGELANAYAQTGQTFKSENLSKRIIKLYPDSLIRLTGPITQARTLVVRDRADEALNLLHGIQDDLPLDVAPDPREMQILGDFHMARAQAHEKKGQAQQALEDYLKVVAVYYRPENRANEARRKADALLDQNQNLIVP